MTPDISSPWFIGLSAAGFVASTILSLYWLGFKHWLIVMAIGAAFSIIGMIMVVVTSSSKTHP